MLLAANVGNGQQLAANMQCPRLLAAIVRKGHSAVVSQKPNSHSAKAAV